MNVVGNRDNPAKINIKASTGTEDSEINIYTDGKVAVSANQLLAVARKRFCKKSARKMCWARSYGKFNSSTTCYKDSK